MDKRCIYVMWTYYVLAWLSLIVISLLATCVIVCLVAIPFYVLHSLSIDLNALMNLVCKTSIAPILGVFLFLGLREAYRKAEKICSPFDPEDSQWVATTGTLWEEGE